MFGHIGQAALRRAVEIAAIATLPYAAAKGAWMERKRGRRIVIRTTLTQIYYTAVEPLPVFLPIAVTIGSIAVFLADFLMRPNGLAPHIPRVIAEAVVREIIPFFIALIMVGRSGTAIATELGYMRVNQEIDALDVAGINIDYYLVLPRILGVTVSTMALTVAMSAAALVVGYTVGSLLGVLSAGLLFTQILRWVTVGTLAYSLLKAASFGLIVSSVNCYHGLGVGRSFTEIPQANVRGSVQCYLGCFFLNTVISIHALLNELL